MKELVASSAANFAGHLGHLTPEQERAFATFKETLAKDGLYKPATDTEKASHDDPTLLRFLRARNFVPPKAEKQFYDYEAWRKKHDVDNLFETFPADEFEDARRFYPRWTGRRDKQGLPLYVYRLASLAGPLQKELDTVPPERRYQRIIALYEVMVRFILPLCTHLPRSSAPTPVSSVVTIIDLHGVAFTAMWALRAHLQQASTLATANYPETLSATIVVHAPGFFQTIWRWVKVWFDEGTQAKIHVLGDDPGPEILKLVDKKDLPKVYGGDLDWEFEDEPALDEPAREAIAEMPKGPVVFIDGKVIRPRERTVLYSNGNESQQD